MYIPDLDLPAGLSHALNHDKCLLQAGLNGRVPYHQKSDFLSMFLLVGVIVCADAGDRVPVVGSLMMTSRARFYEDLKQG